VQEPLAGDGVAVDFGGGEIPVARGLERGFGEEAAGSGGDLGGGDVARGIHVDFDNDLQRAVNGISGSLGNFGKYLAEDFAGSHGA